MIASDNQTIGVAVIVILALLIAAQASAAPPPPVVKVVPPCRQVPQTVGGRRGTKPHTLAAEPPAQPYYTVLREDGGCTRPVPVSEHSVAAPRD